MLKGYKHLDIYKIMMAIVLLILLISLAACWKPFIQKNDATGYVKYRWSGFSALFNKEKFGIQRNYYLKTQLNGQDGPYVFYENEHYIAYEVSETNTLVKNSKFHGDTLMVRIPNKDLDSFTVSLGEQKSIQPDEWSEPDKMLVISDIEGNFNGLFAFLVRNKVIDQNYNWTFGSGHVVFLGDFVDRGPHAIQVLWLIYSLEEKAIKSNGHVHYLLGNHEVMNIQGTAKNADPKAVKISQIISGKEDWNEAYKILYDPTSVIGKWLRSKNAIERIGNTLFIHGGISPKIISLKPSIYTINQLIRQTLDSNLYDRNERTDLSTLLAGREGVLWYRGMAIDYKYYRKITVSEFENVLKYFGVNTIIIGHTLNKDISTDFDEQLIKIDVLHGQNKFTGKTQGILYEKGHYWKVNDLGQVSSLH